MPKVTYTSSKGLIQEAGSGITFDNSPVLASPTVFTAAANNTGSLPGLYTISSTGAATVKMPLASAVPGGMFVFRSTTAQAHILTGSGETGGTKVFSSATTNGSSLALNNVVGSSVVLVSDGRSFLVSAISGTITISGN